MRWTGEQRRMMYEHLNTVNGHFEEAVRALQTFSDFRGFDQAEIKRLALLTVETRAATLSCLTNVIETNETNEAGRLQNQRLRRERRAD